MSDVCFRCGEQIREYGIDREGHKLCYGCCAKRDIEELRNLDFGQTIVQYLRVVTEDVYGYTYKKYEVVNFPGTLRIKAKGKEGKHNMAGTQQHVWFKLGDKFYHGVQYGSNSELCYIRRVKNLR